MVVDFAHVLRISACFLRTYKNSREITAPLLIEAETTW